MKRKIISILLAVSMILSLAACGSSASDSSGAGGTSDTAGKSSASDSKNSDAASSKASGGDKTVINYYTWESNEDTNPIIDQFMADNPDIEVVLHVIADTTDAQTQLDIMAMGGSEIDVMQIADGQQFAKAKSGILLSLDDYITADNVDMEADYGSYADWARYDGKYYCLPRHTSVGCVFYNKTMFDELGLSYPKDDWTYAEYETTARAATQGEGSGKVYGTFNHIRPGFWCLFALQKTGFYTEDGMSNIGDKLFRQDLENRKKLDDDGIQKSYNEIVASGTLQNNEFFNEHCAMVMAASWMVRDMKNKEAYPYDFEVGVADFPRLDEDTPLKSTWGSVSALGIPTSSDHPDEAWKFIRYYLEKGSVNIAKNGNVPCYLPSYGDDLVKAFIEGSGLSLEDGQKFFSEDITAVAKMPIGEAMVEYNTIMNDQTSLYLGGAQDLDTTIDNMVTQTNDAIETERAGN